MLLRWVKATLKPLRLGSRPLAVTHMAGERQPQMYDGFAAQFSRWDEKLTPRIYIFFVGHSLHPTIHLKKVIAAM